MHVSMASEASANRAPDPPGIESLPGVCGGELCIVRTRIPVWLLERARQLGLSEAEILTSYPTLRAGDLANAWSFVRSHREEIARQITANEGETVEGRVLRANREP